MYRLFVALILCLLLSKAEAEAFKIPRTHTIPILDSGSDRQYELYVKLPENYTGQPQKAYPVIYFTDAVWHMELLSGATAFLLEDVILVGISWQTDISDQLLQEKGAHVSRFRDYSLVESRNTERQAKYQFGQASGHLSFIRNDVIRHVEKHYRTDASKRAYLGYSLGGLFGAYVLLEQPDTFKHYILGSPSVRGLGDLKELANAQSKPLDADVFISHGSLEQELGAHIERFITLLTDRKDPGLSITHPIITGNHQTASPATLVQSVAWLSAQLEEGQ